MQTFIGNPAPPFAWQSSASIHSLYAGGKSSLFPLPTAAPSSDAAANSVTSVTLAGGGGAPSAAAASEVSAAAEFPFILMVNVGLGCKVDTEVSACFDNPIIAAIYHHKSRASGHAILHSSFIHTLLAEAG